VAFCLRTNTGGEGGRTCEPPAGKPLKLQDNGTYFFIPNTPVSPASLNSKFFLRSGDYPSGGESIPKES